MRKQTLLRSLQVATATSALALAAGMASAEDYTRFGIEEDIPGMCSYESIDAKDYSGRELTIITHAIPVIGEPTKLHAEQFAELTGAEVEVVHVPFGDLFQRIMIPFQTGQDAYDVLFYASLWVGDFNPYLATVPEAYRNSSGMQGLTDTTRDVGMWGGEMKQYIMDGDRHYLKFREDIFSDPEMQARFLEETGRELTVPETWEEYNEVAKVFSGWDWDGDGEPNYGSAEVVKRDDLMFSAFISRAAPYAKHPDVEGGFFFDLETMEPLINNPGWVRGLELFVDAQEAFPPGGTNFGLGDEIFSFGGGETLMSYSWDDALIQAQQEDSPIRNEVNTAMLPGAREVWNRETGEWDTFEEPNRAAYITWGWTSAVSEASQNKDMAFDYLCFFANEANTKHDLQIGRFGVNPYRADHFDSEFWAGELGWDPDMAAQYVETLQSIDGYDNRVFDLRVPGVGQFMTSLAAGVAEAVAGQSTPQEALDGVAEEWTQIVERIGPDRVREAYANVVELEDAR
ncbi:extracellular solute-binding protein [Spiribacter sp. 221]|uniref:ABC transporter substrate-binding protein n=1 Tax=Spiribacter onubensis TaxID=3122420 RepID=UPI00349FB6B7